MKGCCTSWEIKSSMAVPGAFNNCELREQTAPHPGCHPRISVSTTDSSLGTFFSPKYILPFSAVALSSISLFHLLSLLSSLSPLPFSSPPLFLLAVLSEKGDPRFSLLLNLILWPVLGCFQFLSLSVVTVDLFPPTPTQEVLEVSTVLWLICRFCKTVSNTLISL